MMKEEFESMIGKEVDAEIFRMYEAMYLACPENVTKQDFVALLDISKIPESERAIKAREEARQARETARAAVRGEINELKERIRTREIDIKESELDALKGFFLWGDAASEKRHRAIMRNDIKAMRANLRELESKFALL